jgi:hypothetical protein
MALIVGMRLVTTVMMPLVMMVFVASGVMVVFARVVTMRVFMLTIFGALNVNVRNVISRMTVP